MEKQKKAPHLLSIANEHAEPGSHFAVGTQQETADVGDKRTDRLVCCIWFIIQSESHTEPRQVTLLHLQTQN